MSDDDHQFLIDGRPVPELKVVELRKELEQRSLPKSGNKKELVERLINFLREEQAEENGQRQQPQMQNVQPAVEQQQISPSSGSPTTSQSMPDMVAQYLAQQQLQLEAARRDAEKLRASTSSNEEAEMVQQQVTGEPQPAAKTEATTEKSSLKQQDSGDFIPEEPTNGGQKEKQRENAVDSKVEKAEDEEARRSSTPESSVTEQEEEEEAGDERAEMKETVEEEKVNYEEQPTERIEEQQMVEENEKEAIGAEFVPDEPNARKEPARAPKDTLKAEVQSSTAPGRRTTVKDAGGSDFEEMEEEEEDEEKEEPDYRGARRRSSTPAYQQEEEESPAELSSSTTTAKQLQDNRVSSATAEPAKNDGELLVTAGEAAGEQAEVVTNEKPPPVQQIASAGRRRSSFGGGAIAGGVELESSKLPPTEEVTPDGFIRRRAPSPARNQPSRWIHIRGLKRPYTIRALLELLGKFGTVDDSAFWIDNIKSNCIVSFETAEQAQQARDRLHNVVWPAASSDALCVEFSSEEKYKRRKAEDEQPAAPVEPRGGTAPRMGPGGPLGLTIVVDNRVPDSPSGPQVVIQHEKEQQHEAETRKRKAEELEKSQKTLDTIFKKTKALPSLYYLPLSEAEVAAKRHKNSSQNSSTRQHSASSHHQSSSNIGGSREHHRDRDTRRPSGSSSHLKSSHRRDALSTSAGRR